MDSVSINSFDRSKKFYPLVMHYFALYHGARDLATVGSVGPRTVANALKDRFGEAALSIPNEELQKNLKEVEASLSKLFGPFELKSEFQENHIKFEISDMAHEFSNNFPYLLSFSTLAAGFLLIVAYETVIDDLTLEQKERPAWQFLRHCRHAAAHDGKFSFLGAEPKRPAIWGKFVLTKELQGTRLFKDMEKIGLMSPGDPIRLLWDIENQIVNQK